jgi:von Willebrand factor type A domain
MSTLLQYQLLTTALLSFLLTLSRLPFPSLAVIKGRAAPRTPLTACDDMQDGAASGSPRSVMAPPLAAESLAVVLLVDGSSSVTEDDFSAQRSFCTQLVHSLRETHDNASVAVLQFNQYPKVHAGLTNVHKPAILAAVDGMHQMMGSTDIAAPIRRARQMLAEDGSPGEKAIVLITDGQTHSDELRDAEREARQASVDSGARLFALGVGRDVDEVGLRRVACGTSEMLERSPREMMCNGEYFALRKMKRGA